MQGDFGRWLDRSKPLNFTFEGDKYQGYAGDVIASALAAEGCWILSRSFKYHRPRAVMSMAGHEANSLVGLPEEPNVYADIRLLEEAMQVHAQNYRGSLAHDRLAIMDRLACFSPVGFYYRSFFKPQGAWKFWEPIIRRIAGLGVVNKKTPHKYYDKAYGFYDVVVVGGGVSGMAAAIEAAKYCSSVLLVEEAPHLGGSLCWQRLDVASQACMDLCNSLRMQIEEKTTIEVMTSAVATGLFTDAWLSVIRGSRLHKIRAGSVVVATGLIEQPGVFHNNDRPGVMLASAAQKLMRLYAVSPGKKVVVVTSNDVGYGAALDCLDAGVSVVAVVDTRRNQPVGEVLHEEAVNRGVQMYYGSSIVSVAGSKHVQSAEIARVDGTVRVTARIAKRNCDAVLTSFGWTPNSSLLSQANVRLSYNQELAMHCPIQFTDPLVYAAGGVRGILSVDRAIEDARKVARSAATGVAATDLPFMTEAIQALGNHPYPVFVHDKSKCFVDFDEDLQTKDILNAQKHGFRDIQLTKRYSTLGMGPSQGRHSNVNAIRIIARYSKQPEDSVGTTTARPPYRTEKFGHLAGRSFDPVRRTAMHHRHEELAAEFMPAGAWLRPAYYRQSTDASVSDLIAAEVLACRENLGIIDVSTLGGIDVRGADAAEFVNRMYTWAYLKQKVNHARYLLMTDESGVAIDDGVACRFHENHYYLTATTSGVETVYREMLRRQAQWRLDVDIAHVTSAYAAVNVAGPKSRELLQALTDFDLSGDNFPYMGAFQAEVAGIPARLLRVGFVGELGYEIHVPTSQGEALWDILMERGQKLAIRPFGVEAQRVMRLEKGYIIVGQDTDGLTTPHEAGMAWAIGKKKSYYQGKRSVDIQKEKGVVRKLVGFKLKDARAAMPKECHLIIDGDAITGRVTSAVFSPTLQEVIGLAYVAIHQAEHGQIFFIRVDGGNMVEAYVAEHPFYDPRGARQEL